MAAALLAAANAKGGQSSCVHDPLILSEEAWLKPCYLNRKIHMMKGKEGREGAAGKEDTDQPWTEQTQRKHNLTSSRD